MARINYIIRHIGKIVSFWLLLIPALLTASNLAVSDIVDMVGKSIVMITAESEYSDPKFGSGVMVNAMGIVVTNIHVIEGANRINVRLSSGSSAQVAGWLGADEERDLITVQLRGEFKTGFTILMKNSEGVKVGERVVAIGNPRGFESSVSDGIISGIRVFDTGTKVLQTTAPISPGSSGGGLFNRRGELVGITSYGYTDGQNLNFAYPIDYVLPLIQESNLKPLVSAPRYNGIRSVSESEAIVIVTKSGSKYHLPGCGYLRKSYIPISISQASASYSPCSRCFIKGLD